jgi:hypothetical protein
VLLSHLQALGRSPSQRTFQQRSIVLSRLLRISRVET